MDFSIREDTLAEIELELNRKEILHFRSLIISVSAPGRFIVLAPAPLSQDHGLKPGDSADLYASLLSQGDTAHTLHIKARVTSVEKTAHGSLLHFESTGFIRPIDRPHFHTLRTNTSVLLEPHDGTLPPVPASLRSISLDSAHIHTAAPLPKDSLWKTVVPLGGKLFTLLGRMQPFEDNRTLDSGHAAMLRFTDIAPETRREMADIMESVQKEHIRTRASMPLHDVFDAPDLQDSLILEHLVSRSRHRIALDFLELAGWFILMLICFDIVQAAPPETNFFDRVFQLTPPIVWNKGQLRLLPLYFTLQVLIFITGLGLHQFIHYRGNTRFRWRLWLMAALSLLVYLSVRTHL